MLPESPDDFRAVLGALTHEQLVEICRRSALDGLQSICRRELGGRIVANAVATLFPELPPRRIADVTQQIGFNSIRNASLKTVASVPGRWEAVIRAPDHEQAKVVRKLEGPAILAFWHFGPVNMLPLGFRRVGVTAQIFTRATPNRWTEEFAPMRLNVRDPQQSVSALRRALQHLKKGGKVAVALDGSMGKRDIEIPFLGRRYSISRGASGLARLTGAPIIPCTMQWEPNDWEMAVRFFDPAPRPSADDPEIFEREMLVSAGRIFEAYCREHPEQLKIDQIATLIDSPKLEP